MTDLIVQSGDHHPLVPTLKRRLGFGLITDEYDHTIEQRIRGVQLVHGLDQHGQVDEPTLAVLGIEYGRGGI